MSIGERRIDSCLEKDAAAAEIETRRFGGERIVIDSIGSASHIESIDMDVYGS